ncbi:MAG: sulfate adenylyltransferase subunit CysN [Geminicoccaceae bacterium]
MDHAGLADVKGLDVSEKSLLRFITCGSVDDGKSTLIGRLLYDAKLLLEDQVASLETESKLHGTQDGELDMALLVDGLQAEREQGITIDVAYRYFSTAKRKFIVADTPGHEQYTRNMATGASTADLAIILIDARKGVLQQTRRHSRIADLLGIRHVVLAVNKMDVADYSEDRFNEIVNDYRTFVESQDLSFSDITCIPLSALKGDNVLDKSEAMSWYDGPSLMAHLEAVDVAVECADAGGARGAFRFPVQWVSRPDQNFRGYAGTVVSGSIRPGEHIIAQPGSQQATITRIVTMDGDQTAAWSGDAVTLCLDREIDISRGDVIAEADASVPVTDQFAAHLVWMDEAPLLPERTYLLKLGTKTIGAAVTRLKYKEDVNSGEHLAADTLGLNEVGFVNFNLDQPIAFEPYKDNKALGGFILIDRISNQTVAAGMVAFGLRRATNLVWQEVDVDKAARAKQNRQKPCLLWFTGFSGAGKSTIANLVEKRLHALGQRTYLLDGDNVRHGLNKDLGFTDADRVENIRRVAEVGKLMVDAGLIVMASFISPFRSERNLARELFEEHEFIEVFVDTSIEACERRDPKGLYQRARDGKIPNFTGISSPYEPPENAEIHLQTERLTPEEAAELVVTQLQSKQRLQT